MVTSLFWRPLPILTLTVRQFLGGKAVRVVTALSLLPCVFAAIYLLNKSVATPQNFITNSIFRNLIAPTLLPVTVLILATGALGNEIEDRTLPYLTMKPVSRLRIVLAKFAGILVVSLPIILGGLVLAYLIVTRHQAGDLLRSLEAMLLAGAVEIVAFSAIFLLISLVIPRALLAGIVYTFAWESLLGRFLPGTYFVSIHHYVDAIYGHFAHDQNAINGLAHPTSLESAVITLGIVSIVALALATWRLRRMNLE